MTEHSGETRPLVVGDQIVVTVTKDWLLHHNYVRGPFHLRPRDGRHLEQVGWRGPYGLIPGGMDVDPSPIWEPVYRVVDSGSSGPAAPAPQPAEETRK